MRFYGHYNILSTCNILSKYSFALTNEMMLIKKQHFIKIRLSVSDIQFYVLLSPCLCFVSFLYLDLYVLGDDAWIHADQTYMCLDPHLN